MNKFWNWLAVIWLVGGSVGVFVAWIFADELGMVRGHPDAYGLPEAPECYDARGQC